jgi:hypothetical protein
MHERWNELERGKSAQETKRKHIPTWLFKLADNLDNLYNQLLKKIENINMIGMKKNKEEAINILSEFVPKAEKFSAKVNSYNDYINELEESSSAFKSFKAPSDVFQEHFLGVFLNLIHLSYNSG